MGRGAARRHGVRSTRSGRDLLRHEERLVSSSRPTRATSGWRPRATCRQCFRSKPRSGNRSRVPGLPRGSGGRSEGVRRRGGRCSRRASRALPVRDLLFDRARRAAAARERLRRPRRTSVPADGIETTLSGDETIRVVAAIARAAVAIATIRSIAPRARAGDLRLDRDLVLPVAERVAQLLERDHLHVLADRLLGHGLEALRRAPPCSGGGGSRSRSRRGTASSATCFAKLIIPSVERMCVRSLPNAIALARAAALGVDEQLGVGRLVLPALDVGRPDARVHVALAHPDRSACGPVTRSSQRPRKRSGRKRISLVAGDRLDHGLRVARRAAVVALGLHLGGRVHVRDDDARRDARPSSARSWSAVIDAASEQPASRSGISTVFSGARIDGRLGHEVDAAEDDRLGVGAPPPGARGRASRRRSRPRPAPRAPGSCARGSRRRARARARAPPRAASTISAVGHSTSSETSSERAECVSAPIEMKSTPGLGDRARRSSSVTPPEASSCARPATSCDGLAQLGRRHVVEQDRARRRRRAPRARRRASRPRPRSGGRVRGARGRRRRAIAAGDAQVVVLDRGSRRRGRSGGCAPPPQRTACFSSARRPGVVLRVSRIVAPVPSTAST